MFEVCPLTVIEGIRRHNVDASDSENFHSTRFAFRVFGSAHSPNVRHQPKFFGVEDSGLKGFEGATLSPKP